MANTSANFTNQVGRNLVGDFYAFGHMRNGSGFIFAFLLTILHISSGLLQAIHLNLVRGIDSRVRQCSGVDDYRDGLVDYLNDTGNLRLEKARLEEKHTKVLLNLWTYSISNIPL
jgi:hypothetical protein